jgi:hypothetical protein
MTQVPAAGGRKNRASIPNCSKLGVSSVVRHRQIGAPYVGQFAPQFMFFGIDYKLIYFQYVIGFGKRRSVFSTLCFQ